MDFLIGKALVDLEQEVYKGLVLVFGIPRNLKKGVHMNPA